MWVKRRTGAPPGFFDAEAAGLRWLAEPASLRLPDVLSVEADQIVVTRVAAGAPSPQGAEALGRGLADMHAAGAPRLGAPWRGFIGDLPMDNTGAADWPTFYCERRVLPYLRSAHDRGALTPDDARAIERCLGVLPSLPGAGEPPSRIHGDLWSGNVLWDTGGEAWLIDPAAHGGHRETDLAMLALFGAPYLDRILRSYEERAPLAPGWQARTGLHQLHPLLVHAVLFGGTYGPQAGAAAREALRHWGA